MKTSDDSTACPRCGKNPCAPFCGMMHENKISISPRNNELNTLAFVMAGGTEHVNSTFREKWNKVNEMKQREVRKPYRED